MVSRKLKRCAIGANILNCVLMEGLATITPRSTLSSLVNPSYKETYYIKPLLSLLLAYGFSTKTQHSQNRFHISTSKCSIQSRHIDEIHSVTIIGTQRAVACVESLAWLRSHVGELIRPICKTNLYTSMVRPYSVNFAAKLPW